MAQALVVEGVKNHPACLVCGIAGPLDGFLAKVAGVASEISLGNLSFGRPAEGNPHMFQFVNGAWSIPNHDLYCILITEIVTSLDRIEEVPFPAVLFFIAEGGCDASLCCT